MIYLLLLVLGTALAPAADLTIGRGTGAAGSSVEIPVVLKTAGSAITSVQFDIEYPDAVLTLKVRPGARAESSSKQVNATKSAKNQSRVLLYGVNHNSIEDGVVVVLTVLIKPNAPAGEYRLVGKSAAATNAGAAAIAVNVNSGALTVRAAP